MIDFLFLIEYFCFKEFDFKVTFGLWNKNKSVDLVINPNRPNDLGVSHIGFNMITALMRLKWLIGVP